MTAMLINTLLAQIAALPDSSQVQLITETQVDSAYVQARQDFAYSSLTGAPTNVSTLQTMLIIWILLPHKH